MSTVQGRRFVVVERFEEDEAVNIYGPFEYKTHAETYVSALKKQYKKDRRDYRGSDAAYAYVEEILQPKIGLQRGDAS